jgi:hypothetical protein
MNKMDTLFTLLILLNFVAVLKGAILAWLILGKATLKILLLYIALLLTSTYIVHIIITDIQRLIA